MRIMIEEMIGAQKDTIGIEIKIEEVVMIEIEIIEMAVIGIAEITEIVVIVVIIVIETDI